jgi:nitrogen-specific signal transduction histidine kinase
VERHPAATDSKRSGDRLHPALNDELARLHAELDNAPQGAAWERFLEAVDARFHTADMVAELSDGMRGWSSFENLFHMSPTPTMEQDYTLLLDWMDDLRAQGVTDFRAHLGDDIEAIRAIAPLIRVVAANPAAIRAVGVPPEKILGPIDRAVVNDESLPGWLAQLEAVWNGVPAVEAAFVAGTPSGGRYDAESTLSAPLVDGRPDFSRAVFTVTDVTAHRDEERRMRLLMDAKNRFLAAVSHEIRTPLTAVLGFARVLVEDIHDLGEDDLRLMVSSIAEQAQDVANLVEDLLVASRAEAGQIEVANTTFDVIRQVREMLAVGGSYAQNVAVSAPEQQVRAFGDPARVRQILRNLLTNAERYGGPEVSIEVAAHPGLVTIAVCDNGPAIPAPQSEQIFELYHTAHETPGKPGSVGIGLAVSRQLAELMGGRLEYTGRPGHSVFELTLRAAPS